MTEAPCDVVEQLADIKVNDQREAAELTCPDTGQDNQELFKSKNCSGCNESVSSQELLTGDNELNKATNSDLQVDTDRFHCVSENFNSESESESNYESAEEEQVIINDEEDNEDADDSAETNLSEEEKEERRTEAQNHKEEGNQCFREERFEDAVQCYTKALKCCPKDFPRDRSIMFSNRGACKLKLGQNEESIKDCSSAIELHPQYLKPLLRRAELYEKVDKLDDALVDYQKVVELDPSQHIARAACMRLPDQIKERNEKLKEEMLGKLKDLGNMFLKPFGLSTENFQLNKDENTGGYSVNFKQNGQ